MNVPKVLNIKIKTKLSLLAAINRSTDHLIQKLTLYSLQNYSQKGVLDISAVCASIFKDITSSGSSLPPLKKECKEKMTTMSTQQWDNHLQMLQVQRKFDDVVTLEKENQSWKKIMRTI